jgi:hypothetical protein
MPMNIHPFRGPYNADTPILIPAFQVIDTFKTFDEYFIECIKMCRLKAAKDNSTPFTKIAKLGEEFGEFCEAVSVHNGFSQHKALKEGIFGEAADIINCVVACLVINMPKASDEEILTELKKELKRKLDKFSQRIKVTEKNG